MRKYTTDGKSGYTVRQKDIVIKFRKILVNTGNRYLINIGRIIALSHRFEELIDSLHLLTTKPIDFTMIPASEWVTSGPINLD